MNWISWIAGQKSAGRGNSIVLTLSYLLVLATAARAYSWFPELRLPLMATFGAAALLFVVARLVDSDVFWLRILIICGQLACMVALFVIVPPADYWALLMLPAVIDVMQKYERRRAWTA